LEIPTVGTDALTNLPLSIRGIRTHIHTSLKTYRLPSCDLQLPISTLPDRQAPPLHPLHRQLQPSTSLGRRPAVGASPVSPTLTFLLFPRPRVGDPSRPLAPVQPSPTIPLKYSISHPALHPPNPLAIPPSLNQTANENLPAAPRRLNRCPNHRPGRSKVTS